MKYLFHFILFAIFSISIHAQDLVITQENDSLNCKITQVKEDNIYFTFLYDGTVRNTLLPVDQMKEYQYNYYQTPEVPLDKIPGQALYPRFRASINAGWSYRTGKLADNIPADLKNYMKELKSGFHYNLDASYYFTEYLGAGFKYHSFNAQNKINVYATDTNDQTQYGNMSDNITIRFIGPFFSTRFLNADKKNALLLNLGIGYIGYNDEGVLISDYITLKGSSFGACWEIAYDIGIAENWALVFQVSSVTGYLSQVVKSDGIRTETIKLENRQFEDLTHINLSIGLRFSK
jgi:hypothetical protein